MTKVDTPKKIYRGFLPRRCSKTRYAHIESYYLEKRILLEKLEDDVMNNAFYFRDIEWMVYKNEDFLDRKIV